MLDRKHSRMFLAALVIASIGVVCLCGYFIAGPFITVHTLQHALATRDSSGLDKIIDYPILRMHLKKQIEGIIQHQVVPPFSSETLNQWAQRAIINTENAGIDIITTPTGLAFFLKSMYMLSRLEGNTHADSANNLTPYFHILDHPTYHFLSLRCISAESTTQKANRLAFIICREGIHWKVTNIIFSH